MNIRGASLRVNKFKGYKKQKFVKSKFASRCQTALDASGAEISQLT